MTLEALAESIKKHPIFEREIPVQQQLGLPYIYNENGQLTIAYHLHQRKIRDRKMIVYPSEYELALRYPFQKIAYFYANALPEESTEPVGSIDLHTLMAEGKLLVNTLYRCGNRVLEDWEKEHALVQENYASYLEAFGKAAALMKQDDFFGG